MLEASIVLQSKLGDAGVADLDGLLADAGVRCVAVDLAQAHAAQVLLACAVKPLDDGPLLVE